MYSYLTEGFVAQATQFYKVREAKDAILNNKAQQFRGRLQQTLPETLRQKSQSFPKPVILNLNVTSN